jgi:hypothetical protein
VAADEIGVLGHEGVAEAADEALCAAHVGDDRALREAARNAPCQAVYRLNGGAEDDQVRTFGGGLGCVKNGIAPGLPGTLGAHLRPPRPDVDARGEAAFADTHRKGASEQTGGKDSELSEHAVHR